MGRMSRRTLSLDGYTLNPGDLSWTELEKLGACTCYDRTPPENIVERIGDGAIAFTNKTPLTRDILQQCPALLIVDEDLAEALGTDRYLLPRWTLWRQSRLRQAVRCLVRLTASLPLILPGRQKSPGNGCWGLP